MEGKELKIKVPKKEKEKSPVGEKFPKKSSLRQKKVVPVFKVQTAEEGKSITISFE
jgi:hypothetical protein